MNDENATGENLIGIISFLLTTGVSVVVIMSALLSPFIGDDVTSKIFLGGSAIVVPSSIVIMVTNAILNRPKIRS